MNDFTKEELQEIIEMANDIESGSQAHGLQMHFKIRDKAQSMIDNYCDHEWNINELMKKIVLNPGEAFPVECKKCGLPYRC